jgi:hypothetical protein
VNEDGEKILGMVSFMQRLNSMFSKGKIQKKPLQNYAEAL